MRDVQPTSKSKSCCCGVITGLKLKLKRKKSPLALWGGSDVYGGGGGAPADATNFAGTKPRFKSN